MKTELKVVTVVCGLILFSVATCAWSASIRVPEDFTSIQEAVTAAEESDSIIVGRGFYIERDIRFSGKAVVLLSDEGPAGTVIDLAQSGRAFLFDGGESLDTKIAGFTIKDGISEGDGGGILCKGSSPTIEDCILESNKAAAHNGGGLSCRDYSSPALINCIIRDNESVHLGGGVYCSNHSSPELTGCTIESNIAGDNVYDGGGVFCSNHSNPTFTQCTIRENTAMNGAGVYCLNFSSPVFEECSILENIAGIGGGGVACFFYSSPGFIKCTISENESARHSSYGYDAGGGVLCAYGSSPDFRACFITKNASYNGGGVDCIGNSSPRFVNCIIADNYTDTDGGGLRVNVDSNVTIYYCTITRNEAGTRDPELERGCGGALRVNKSSVKIVNSILWGNTAEVEGDEIYQASGYINISYSDIGGGWPGTGNMDGDPEFINPDEGDYHLKAGSKCIDQGRDMPSIDVDFEGDPRPSFKTQGFDIGADEVVLFGDPGDVK